MKPRVKAGVILTRYFPCPITGQDRDFFSPERYQISSNKDGFVITAPHTKFVLFVSSDYVAGFIQEKSEVANGQDTAAVEPDNISNGDNVEAPSVEEDKTTEQAEATVTALEGAP